VTRLLTAFAIAIVAAVFGAPAAAVEPQNDNWHVHDCGLPESVNACGGQHKGAGFFPSILDQSNAAYVADPAQCPNATDKGLLPSAGESESDVVRAGVCMNSTTIIHLRTVPVGTSGPAGWRSLTGPEAGYVTYYLLTSR